MSKKSQQRQTAWILGYDTVIKALKEGFEPKDLIINQFPNPYHGGEHNNTWRCGFHTASEKAGGPSPKKASGLFQ